MTLTAQQRADRQWATPAAQKEARRRDIERTATYDLHTAQQDDAPLEQAALPGLDPEPEAPRGPVCWNCGTAVLTRRDYRLCPTCEHAGADPHWISCTRPGHDHVRRRSVRGQQHFTCNERTPR